jgi:hypothetical protein
MGVGRIRKKGGIEKNMKRRRKPMHRREGNDRNSYQDGQ